MGADLLGVDSTSFGFFEVPSCIMKIVGEGFNELPDPCLVIEWGEFWAFLNTGFSGFLEMFLR